MENNPPRINPRFIYTTKFRNKIGKIVEIPDLNADGYIDFAHQVGIGCINSTLISREMYKDENGNVTWWATVKVEVVMKSGIKTAGISCCSSRDPRVTQPGYEVSVAETRALKRALALATNVTEKVISDALKEKQSEYAEHKPRREFVDEFIPEPPEPEPEHEQTYNDTQFDI